MSGGLIFLLSVVAVYLILTVNALARFVRGRFAKRSAAKYAKAQTIPREKYTPYRKPLLNIDGLVTAVETKVRQVSGDDPVMDERINAGSDTFFEAEEKNATQRIRYGSPPLLPPDPELEAVRRLWPKSVHQPRKRTRLSNVRKPADPGDGPLEPEPEP